MLHAFWAKRKFLEIPNQKIFPLTCDFTVATCGGSHQRCSIKKSILENSAKFSGKHLYQSLFFNKVKGLSPATLLKKRLWHRCFPVNFVKFLRTAFLENTSQLLLKTAVSFYRSTSYSEVTTFNSSVEGHLFRVACVSLFFFLFMLSNK